MLTLITCCISTEFTCVLVMLCAQGRRPELHGTEQLHDCFHCGLIYWTPVYYFHILKSSAHPIRENQKVEKKQHLHVAWRRNNIPMWPSQRCSQRLRCLLGALALLSDFLNSFTTIEAKNLKVLPSFWRAGCPWCVVCIAWETLSSLYCQTPF